MLTNSVKTCLEELIGLLHQLSDDEFSKPCAHLSDASIGEHTRHIIEMFQCLENFYAIGIINYDNRERNGRIQTDTKFAIEKIREIQKSLRNENKKIELEHVSDGQINRIETNYHRELLYNLEHCIHHQALIKVAVLQCESVKIDDNFGVARSTIEYRNQCAQ